MGSAVAAAAAAVQLAKESSGELGEEAAAAALRSKAAPVRGITILAYQQAASSAWSSRFESGNSDSSDDAATPLMANPFDFTWSPASWGRGYTQLAVLTHSGAEHLLLYDGASGQARMGRFEHNAAVSVQQVTGQTGQSAAEGGAAAATGAAAGVGRKGSFGSASGACGSFVWGRIMVWRDGFDLLPVLHGTGEDKLVAYHANTHSVSIGSYAGRQDSNANGAEACAAKRASIAAMASRGLLAALPGDAAGGVGGGAGGGAGGGGAGGAGAGKPGAHIHVDEHHVVVNELKDQMSQLQRLLEEERRRAKAAAEEQAALDLHSPRQQRSPSDGSAERGTGGFHHFSALAKINFLHVGAMHKSATEKKQGGNSPERSQNGLSGGASGAGDGGDGGDGGAAVTLGHLQKARLQAKRFVKWAPAEVAQWMSLFPASAPLAHGLATHSATHEVASHGVYDIIDCAAGSGRAPGGACFSGHWVGKAGADEHVAVTWFDGQVSLGGARTSEGEALPAALSFSASWGGHTHRAVYHRPWLAPGPGAWLAETAMLGSSVLQTVAGGNWSKSAAAAFAPAPVAPVGSAMLSASRSSPAGGEQSGRRRTSSTDGNGGGGGGNKLVWGTHVVFDDGAAGSRGRWFDPANAAREEQRRRAQQREGEGEGEGGGGGGVDWVDQAQTGSAGRLAIQLNARGKAVGQWLELELSGGFECTLEAPKAGRERRLVLSETEAPSQSPPQPQAQVQGWGGGAKRLREERFVRSQLHGRWQGRGGETVAAGGGGGGGGSSSVRLCFDGPCAKAAFGSADSSAGELCLQLRLCNPDASKLLNMGAAAHDADAACSGATLVGAEVGIWCEVCEFGGAQTAGRGVFEARLYGDGRLQLLLQQYVGSSKALEACASFRRVAEGAGTDGAWMCGFVRGAGAGSSGPAAAATAAVQKPRGLGALFSAASPSSGAAAAAAAAAAVATQPAAAPAEHLLRWLDGVWSIAEGSALDWGASLRFCAATAAGAQRLASSPSSASSGRGAAAADEGDGWDRAGVDAAAMAHAQSAGEVRARWEEQVGAAAEHIHDHFVTGASINGVAEAARKEAAAAVAATTAAAAGDAAGISPSPAASAAAAAAAADAAAAGGAVAGGDEDPATAITREEEGMTAKEKKVRARARAAQEEARLALLGLGAALNRRVLAECTRVKVLQARLYGWDASGFASPRKQLATIGQGGAASPGRGGGGAAGGEAGLSKEEQAALQQRQRSHKKAHKIQSKRSLFGDGAGGGGAGGGNGSDVGGGVDTDGDGTDGGDGEWPKRPAYDAAEMRAHKESAMAKEKAKEAKKAPPPPPAAEPKMGGKGGKGGGGKEEKEDEAAAAAAAAGTPKAKTVAAPAAAPAPAAAAEPAGFKFFKSHGVMSTADGAFTCDFERFDKIQAKSPNILFLIQKSQNSNTVRHCSCNPPPAHTHTSLQQHH
jgi:hypothetical protein